MNDDESMDIIYTLTTQDYWAVANALVRRNSTPGKSIMAAINLMLWPLVIGLGVFVSTHDWLKADIGGYGALLFRITVGQLLRRRNHAQSINEYPDAIGGQYRLCVAKEGVSVESPQFNLDAKWSYFSGIETTKAYVLFRIAKTNALIVPLSSFHDAFEAERFASLAKAYRAGTPLAPAQESDSWPPRPHR